MCLFNLCIEKILLNRLHRNKDTRCSKRLRLVRVRDDWATWLSLCTFLHWRRWWQPAPVFLPGRSHGRGSLVGCWLGGHTSRTRLKRLSSSISASSKWTRWRDWKEGLYLAVAGMGEGPMKGPPLPAVGRLLPTLGLEGTGASGVIWVQCRIVTGPEMTSSTFCPVLPFTAEAKSATQRAC